jgi:hypothetical protein
LLRYPLAPLLKTFTLLLLLGWSSLGFLIFQVIGLSLARCS